ncbi:pulmonary surfactant-associated protein C isoform X2 [Rhinatrema bivittatum]|uniref:pulmonary surfactant-associated protein C isoform X2 n=1 Tax=Rhinatrema bivittatum TaxID=194408 RepID=UPI00112C065A|nr:pulmonary surfactant-associated protein C isoform X2 [Rhinatrema bivittatum]
MDPNIKETFIESPPVYTTLPIPKIPCCPTNFKKLLFVVLCVVVVVIVLLGVLLLGLHMTQKHTETIFQMTIRGQEGEDLEQHLAMNRKEEGAMFHISTGPNTSATLVYNYNKLLICYRPWPGQVCYLTRMTKENIPSLDTISKKFLGRKESPRNRINNVQSACFCPLLVP